MATTIEVMCKKCNSPLFVQTRNVSLTITLVAHPCKKCAEKAEAERDRLRGIETLGNVLIAVIEKDGLLVEDEAAKTSILVRFKEALNHKEK